MPGLFAELYRSSLCHMIQKLQAFMSGANLGTHTLTDSYNVALSLDLLASLMPITSDNRELIFISENCIGGHPKS